MRNTVLRLTARAVAANLLALSLLAICVRTIGLSKSQFSVVGYAIVLALLSGVSTGIVLDRERARR
jgi:hypothetical protein